MQDFRLKAWKNEYVNTILLVPYLKAITESLRLSSLESDKQSVELA